MEVPAGGGGSLGDVTIVFQHQTEQLLGGSQMQKVVEVGALTWPSQVFFQFRLPAFKYKREVGVVYAEGFSLAIEGILTDANVAGAAYRQDLGATGMLLDELEVFWQTEDGVSSGSVVASMPSLDSGIVASQVAAAIASYQ